LILALIDINVRCVPPKDNRIVVKIAVRAQPMFFNANSFTTHTQFRTVAYAGAKNLIYAATENDHPRECRDT
jgi:hypothetical protein